MRRRLGRLDGGGKSSWRRLGTLLRTGVGGLTAAAASGLRFGIRVLRAGLRAFRGARRRLRGVKEGMWASSVVVVRRPGAGGASSGAESDCELATGWPSGG